jgi:hypothetical protein
LHEVLVKWKFTGSLPKQQVLFAGCGQNKSTAKGPPRTRFFVPSYALINEKPKGKQVLRVILCKKKDYLTGRGAGEERIAGAGQRANTPVGRAVVAGLFPF